MSNSQVDVTEAGDADQALAALRRETPDLVFLDIALPESKGINFIESIRSRLPDVQIVVLTSRDSVEHQEASFQKGADYFLSKEKSRGLHFLEVIQAALKPRAAT